MMPESMSIPFEFEAAAPGGNALLTITMDECDSRKVRAEKAEKLWKEICRLAGEFPDPSQKVMSLSGR
jgi:hypothetical protein